MGSVFTDPDEWRRHHLGAAKSGRQLTADEAEKVHRVVRIVSSVMAVVVSRECDVYVLSAVNLLRFVGG